MPSRLSPRNSDPERPSRKPAPLPPSFYSNDSIHDHGSGSTCFRTCCCCCCILFILLILILVCFTLFFYFWFHPQAPDIHLESFKVVRFNVEAPPNGAAVLDAESAIRIGIENPNHNLEILYDRTRVWLKAENGVKLGELAVPAFVQGANNVTNMDLTLRTKEPLEGQSGQEVQKGYENKKLLVMMELESGIGVKAVGLRAGPFALHAVCQGIQVTQDGAGGSPECRVKVLNWYV